MILVIGASVAAKWFLRDAQNEEDTDAALTMLHQVVEGDVQALQPPHFAAEVAAVLARLKPQIAHDDVLDLLRET